MEELQRLKQSNKVLTEALVAISECLHEGRPSIASIFEITTKAINHVNPPSVVIDEPVNMVDLLDKLLEAHIKVRP